MRRLLAFCFATASVIALSPQSAQAQAFVNDSGALYSLPVVSLRDIPFRTVVRQQYDYSCGSAALATLLQYHYGVTVSEAETFKAMYAVGDQKRIRDVGFSLLDIKTYLASRGFEGDGYRATFEQLVRANRPAIAVVTAGTYRHFVVVKGARDGKVLIGDPATGLKTYTRAEFEKVWNGIIFAIHDVKGAHVSYNGDEEWNPYAIAPLGQPLGNDSLSSFTRELPPLYQISPMVTSSIPAPCDLPCEP